MAHVGDIEIVHPFLPDPASPSVAAVYLTVRNTGSAPDRLVSVASPSAASSMMMTEQGGTSGSAAAGGTGALGTMAPLRSLVIPGHGTASLRPGQDHLMLESPAPMKVGQYVEVTLRFARAGSVTVEVPVVPLSAIIDDDGSPTTTVMKGMDMASTRSA